jgi:hypothetical protein
MGTEQDLETEVKLETKQNLGEEHPGAVKILEAKPNLGALEWKQTEPLNRIEPMTSRKPGNKTNSGSRIEPRGCTEH